MKKSVYMFSLALTLGLTQFAGVGSAFADSTGESTPVTQPTQGHSWCRPTRYGSICGDGNGYTCEYGWADGNNFQHCYGADDLDQTEAE